jgi:chromosome segregation ATPase
MTEIANSDDVLHRAQQLETYITLSEETLKSLRIMKQEADSIIGSLGQRKDELNHHQQDLVEYLKKLQMVSQKADVLLTPMTDQKQELESLTKKLAEGIAGIDGVVQQKMEPLAEKLDHEVKALENEFHTTNEKFHKGLDGSVVDLLQKRDEIVKNLSQRVDSCEKLAGVQKAAVEEQGRTVEREGKDISDLRKALQELKATVEKQKQEFKSLTEKQNEEFKGLTQKQNEEFKGLVEKQKEEMTAQWEKRHQELNGTIAELNDKHIKNLEKDHAQIKSALNAVISKLGNVKFKKLLGL